MFSVGLGKYIYIYLTNSDWTYIQSGAFGSASNAVCYLIGGVPLQDLLAEWSEESSETISLTK